MSKIFVTGCAGFIGMHTALSLLDQGHFVFGVDNLNSYYDVKLKEDRLRRLYHPDENFAFVRLDTANDYNWMDSIFEHHKFDCVINLAAQPGVRYSLENPHAYVASNVVGFMNVLEICRNHKIKHLVYASSSSVYGNNDSGPFKEDKDVTKPISIYAATKVSNELMANTYSHLYNLPCTGLRFFTVYGPWGRPDMAPFLFTEAITKGKEIKVFNNGNLLRDFTYVDDIVKGVVDLFPHTPEGQVPHEVFNIGNSSPVKLMDFINSLERSLGKEANKVFLPMQDGDVYMTHADTTKLQNKIGFKPSTDLDMGIAKFVDWYKEYYK